MKLSSNNHLWWFFVGVFIIEVGWQVDAARILGIFPVPSRSHYNLGSSLMQTLARSGHDVTLISSFSSNPERIPKEWKYRDIVLTGFIEDQQRNGRNMFDSNNFNPLMMMWFLNSFGNEITEKTLNHTNVRNLLHNKSEHFDVIIVEQFVNDALKYFAHHFNAHLVLYSTFASSSWINSLVANPAPPSYVTEVGLTGNEYTFWFRLKNIVLTLISELNRQLIFYPAQDRILHDYYPTAPALSQLLYNASLVFVNTHISTTHPVPRVPNIIDIGGHHVQPPQPLPSDLQQYMDGSQQGVIYFSMGSVLQCQQMHPDKRDAILDAFRRLKYNVLWKWENDTMENKPDNVMIRKWLPQQDVLAHPKVRLFITHGGLLSLTETVYHGVPILAIPIFGDQEKNAEYVRIHGYGNYLQYSSLTADSFAEAINDVLSNPKYRLNVEKRSRLFHDRPETPQFLIDYWIQHIIRHKGGKHLMVDGIKLPWYVYHNVDVMAVGAIIFVFLIRKICGCFTRLPMCTKNRQQQQAPKKKNKQS